MLELSVLHGDFAICRLAASSKIPDWAMSNPFFSVTRTMEELSIVCPSRAVPPDVRAERGWRCLKVRGPLAFDQVGVLLSLAEPLAKAGVSIFAVSTYDTDYVLVRGQDLARALAALRASGHVVLEDA